MSNFFKNYIFLVQLILKLCASVSGQSTIKDLAIICGLQNGEILSTAPPQCTAMGLHTSYFRLFQRDYSNLTVTIPYLIIMDTIDFTKLPDNIDTIDYNATFSDLVDYDFNFLVFDHTYDLKPADAASITQYSKHIETFLDKTKAYFPDKLIGLVLSADIKSMEESIDLSIVDNQSDIYILASGSYRNCDHQTHQADMVLLTTPDDIMGSLTDIKAANISLSKIIYTINIEIISNTEGSTEPMGYSYLCEKKLSIGRKYCFNTVPNLFDEARLRISQGAAGIYVENIGRDDTNGTCGCITPIDGDPTFRALKTLAGASQEISRNESDYDCLVGGFPIILS